MSLLDLHAGGVVRNGCATLFVGPNGAGKSTIVTFLISNGFTFLSDDNIRLDSDTHFAYPASRSIFLREDAKQLLPRSIRRKLIQHPNGVWQFDDDELDRLRCWDPAPVKAVVVLQSRQGRTTDLTRIGQLEAVTCLIRQCRSLEEVGPPAVHFLAELVRKTELFKISPGDLDESVRLLEDHLP